VKFIAEYRERWGVEPICRMLPFAPATYYAASTGPSSARAVWDQGLKPQIQRVWKENFRVYGADKVWAQLRREGFLVARCTVERLCESWWCVGWCEARPHAPPWARRG
jgi:hypothetical protein